MKHPSSKAIFRVADNLQKMVPMAPSRENLNFMTGNVKETTCGTVCCHGGWYALATKILVDKDSHRFFAWGINQMARDLGFALDTSIMSSTPLIKWACNNPLVWGNENAEYMFASEGKKAFISPKRPYGALILQDIVDHWREVGERVEAIEKADAPKYEDVTAMLAVLPIDETSDLKTIKIEQHV